MKTNILYAVFLAILSLWLVKDDIAYLRMVLNKKEIVQIQGIVTAKYTKAGYIQGYNMGKAHYFIDVRDIEGKCSGTSKIAKDKYINLNIQDKISVFVYKGDCIAAFDMRMYAPPKAHFIPAGFLGLTAIIYLLLALKDYIKSLRMK